MKISFYKISLIDVIMEILVNRVVKNLYVTRLPKGHTHDDIDGVFGIIWNCFMKYSTIETFNEFKIKVENLFQEDSGLIIFLISHILSIWLSYSRYSTRYNMWG